MTTAFLGRICFGEDLLWEERHGYCSFGHGHDTFLGGEGGRYVVVVEVRSSGVWLFLLHDARCWHEGLPGCADKSKQESRVWILLTRDICLVFPPDVHL